MAPPPVIPVTVMVASLAVVAPSRVVPNTVIKLPCSYNVPAWLMVAEYVPVVLVILNSAPLPRCATLAADVPL